MPFFTPSLHVGAWQTLPTQFRLLQSASWLHAEPGRQAGSRATAVHARLAAVLHDVGARRRLARPGADGARAVRRRAAPLARGAARRTRRAAAIDARLVLILYSICARRGLAHVARAMVAAAVAVHAAAGGVGTRTAGRAAAIRIRLGAVAQAVVAIRRRAHQGGGAVPRDAIRAGDTGAAQRTVAASRAAAIDARFHAVLHVVAARRRLAHAGGADVARAIGAVRAPLAGAARSAGAAAAVQARLVAVQHAVHARRRLADRADTDGGRAIAGGGAARSRRAFFAGAAAVQARLVAVLDAVGAGRGLTRARAAHQAQAVDAGVASLRRAARGHEPPPQSTSVSVPFRAPSLQRAAEQTPRSQRCSRNRWLVRQALPRAQGAAPVAAAVDVASPCRSSRRRCRSAAWHTPPAHTPLTQSVAAPQVAPGWHGGHAAAAVDVGLGAVLHAVGARRRLTDAPGADAARAVRGGVARPRRRARRARGRRSRSSVSLPFFTPSVQVAALAHAAGADARDAVRRRPSTARQTRTWGKSRRSRCRSRCRSSRRRCTSAPDRSSPVQIAADAVGADERTPCRRRTPAHVPPQSTSVSVPFFDAVGAGRRLRTRPPCSAVERTVRRP